jgi:hypothetical protein
MASKPQFPLRNLFAATVWMAIWASVYPLMRFAKQLEEQNPRSSLPIALIWLALFTFFMMPMVIVGSVFGSTKNGFIIGSLLALLAIAVILAAMSFA